MLAYLSLLAIALGFFFFYRRVDVCTLWTASSTEARSGKSVFNGLVIYFYYVFIKVRGKSSYLPFLWCL